MEQQVEEVVSQRIPGAHLAIQPEREIGERARLERRPHLQPSARRLQGGVGENGIIVKVEARTKRSAKGKQRGGQQNQSLSHDQLRTDQRGDEYLTPVLRASGVGQRRG